MMQEIRTAVVRMEEGYMRATIKYDNPKYKSEICRAITHIEEKMDLYPEVLHRRDSQKKGFCTVEFSGEDYICSRSCGEFIETLIAKLGIKQCDTE